MDTNHVSIPNWMAKLVCGTCGLVVLVLMAAVPWANNVASNIAEIKTQQVASHRLNEVEIQYLRDRLASSDIQQRDLEARVRELEHMLGSKRTTSRPLSD